MMTSRMCFPKTMFSAVALCFIVAGVAAQPAQAQTFTTLYSFKGSPDGDSPYGGLVRDGSGNLYGTTYWGGVSGIGAVFKLDKTGNESVLHSFSGAPDADLPSSALILDAANNLYGTTQWGGTGTYECTNYATGCGTVFTVDESGNETVLYSFTGKRDGRYPEAGLIMDAKGNFYGTTSTGGSHGFGCGCGTVFKLDRNGKETVLYSFGSGSDGEYPTAGLAPDPAGNFYGTTVAGGKFGLGTVFKLSRSGREIVLYSFKGGRDGSGPNAGLVRDVKGNLYGTTVYGGGYKCFSDSDCGTVFKVDKTGKETVLYRFKGEADGGQPYGGLVLDAGGNLYGTATIGGNRSCNAYLGCGVVFKVDTRGNESTLHSLSGGADGAIPYAGLVRDTEGNLYGTATIGGDPNCQCGVVFEITP